MTLVLVKDRRAWLITAAENTDVRTPPPSPAKWAGTAHLDFPPAQKNSSASSAHSTSDRRGPRREAEAASSQRSLESCFADLALERARTGIPECLGMTTRPHEKATCGADLTSFFLGSCGTRFREARARPGA